MINEKAYVLGSQRSCIRELFEYGRRRSAAVGRENICDFSLGNPSIPAPEKLKQAFIEILDKETPLSVHGYTSAPGCDEVIRDGATGILTKAAPEVLAEAAVGLLLDDERRRAMGARAREVAVREFDVRLQIDRTLDVYAGAAERRARDRG
jgi:hypothetical protein